MTDRWGAFCDDRIRLDPQAAGPLGGMTFAVKDVFDIAGYVCGAGNPDWKRTHAAAARHADAVDTLLGAGARLVGTTHTDELMFGLSGENAHYGTPVNPRAEGRVPGGSSSGSAVAVAAGLVDFALGTDTGGSVRVPASYCGVYGIRPTHGAVSMRGVVPLAPSFDTVGWFAGDPDTLLAVGTVLLADADDGPEPGETFRRALVGRDLIERMDPADGEALTAAVRRVLSAAGLDVRPVTVAGEGIAEWMGVFRRLQGREIWQTHGNWIRAVKPRFGPDVAERFRWSSTLEGYDPGRDIEARERIRGRMLELVGGDGLLFLPAAGGTAPPCNMRGEESEKVRVRTLMISCVAGLAGFPQIVLPWCTSGGLPLGLSIIAGPGQDLRLLRFAARLARTVGTPQTASGRPVRRP
ncbi:MAG: amidase [Thermobacillus sp. ZCTH02-B1]|uniref:amidase n=1 Tax=Thermobacillus sp. ZCTH02-B1 TaxID=1858795 RepID=UPI000B5604DE|nr:amidase [Thermobacillus sp. ZCTH02-B1]OUM93780.1 MAG: amidase [Thermobacillus sp. ZCTH02-B1]